MRVLWFSNIPLLPVTRRLGISDLVGGGWLDSLRLGLENYPDLVMGIASVSKFNYAPFTDKNTSFYNIPNPQENGNIRSVYRRWLHTPDIPNGEKECLNIIDDFKPDIIHIQGTENFYGRIIKEVSIPVLISIQGILSVCEKGYFSGYTFSDFFMDSFSVNFIKGTSSIHNYLTLKKSALREREIIKLCSYFTGRTEFDRNFVSLINPKSSYYHCDRILRSPFYHGSWALESSDPHTIYCTTSPALYKGLGCLLEACSILKANGFEDLKLRIGGPIQNSDIWAFIKRKTKALNLKNEITWLGISSPEMILSELKKASVYVLPSFVDNSPNSLSEAMLVGLPCVASNVGGVPTLIKHGKDGLLFPPGDSYSLAGMIAKIWNDPSIARSLSNNAKSTAQNRHNPQKIAANMVDIYSEIIKNHSK